MILVSSEHTFPYGLLDANFSFNIDNFNGYIYAGEVSPKDTFELLTTRWGIEPNLATALIDIYGGHIYDIKHALGNLYENKNKFRNYLGPYLTTNVKQCLHSTFEMKNDNTRMRETLRRLSINGFV